VEEVRFDRMVPSQVVKRRNACNLAYLPVGALEWHGDHMPFGTDFFTVDHLAQQAARRFGGVAFPPMFYGDVRYILQESRTEWRRTYARTMGVPESFAAAFPLQNNDGSPGYDCPTQPDDGPPAADPLDFTRGGMERQFVRHVAMAMLSIHLYGFRRILLLPGHGGNPGCCEKALDFYRQNARRRSAFGPPAEVRSWFYIRGCRSLEPVLKKHWLHADKWEGSVTMAAAPGTVHPELLPRDRSVIPPAFLGWPFLTEDGYNPERRADWPSYDAFDPRNGTSEEYGRQQVEEILDALGQVVAEMTRPA
jgi:creatinine amidohydrolase/Fe(II)-dependent formamide hydrolase-like protein